MAGENGLPQDVSSRNIKISYWYVSNKLLLRKLLIALLIVLNVVLFGYAIYKAIDILFVQQQSYRQLLADLPVDYTDYTFFRQQNAPRQISLTPVASGQVGGESFDVVAELWNQNTEWTVLDFSLNLVSGGEVVRSMKSFILPGEVKVVGFYDIEDISPSQARLEISDVQWRRQMDFETLKAERMRFTITNQEFRSEVETGFQGKLPVSTLSFDITNDTGFSYWSTDLHIALKSGDQTLSTDFVSIDQFRAGETRSIDINFFEPLRGVQRAEIIPSVNIYDPEAYMQPGS